MIPEIKPKYYFPAKANQKKLEEGQTFVKDRRSANSQTIHELISILEGDLVPEDVTQIGLLPELPPNGGYKNIIIAIEVISRYAFAYPVSSPTAVNTAKVIIDIMTRHAYLPTIMITEKG